MISFFQCAVQSQVLLVPLKSVNPGDIVQPAVIPDNICRGQVGAVIHLKRHFFLVIDGCRREYFLAGQVAKARPSVDFPQPDSPTMPSVSPFLMLKLTLSTA